MACIVQKPCSSYFLQYYSQTPQTLLPCNEFITVQPHFNQPYSLIPIDQRSIHPAANICNNQRYYGDAMVTYGVSIPIYHHPMYTKTLNEVKHMQFEEATKYCDKGRNQTQNGVIQEKKTRLFSKETCKSKSETLKNVMNDGVNKENTPSRPRRSGGSIRRPKNKRPAIEVETGLMALMTGANEEMFYALLTEFIVKPQEMYFNGYPEITANQNVRLLKMSFGKTEPSKRKLSDSDNSESDENSLSEGVERVCTRCSAYFLVTENEYLTKETCTYHWGKIVQSKYTCCSGTPGSTGCTSSQCHVWNGTVAGVNERLEGFKKTKDSEKRNNKVFALDCEMCYTVKGLELSRVTIIGFDGRVVYDHFVRPEREVVDYNTRFSGVTDIDVNSPNAKSFAEVQNDILKLVTAETILVGHALENDLRVLKLLHYKVVDTSLLFPHDRGYPFRNSLKFLMSSLLQKEIQSSSCGHSPYEDATSCLELIHYKLRTKYGNSYLNLIRKK